jgi:hypothetical protein
MSLVTKLISWGTGFSWKIKLAAFVLILSSAFYSGWWAHKTIINAEALKSVQNQLEEAKKAPGKIIKFNQQLRATHVDQTPCGATAIPADSLRLLQQ